MKYSHMIGMLALLVLVGGGCGAPAPSQEATHMEQTVDSEATPEEEEVVLFKEHITFTNVSDMPNATGSGFFGIHEGEMRLATRFRLDAPVDDYFYEGWIICSGTPYSTGALSLNGNMYENAFISTDIEGPCNKYVLTIEPDDGDPAPAAHVMDGEIQDITGYTNIPWDAPIFEGLK